MIQNTAPAPARSWADLCDEVDTLVYVEEYLPAGGTRPFEQWRRGEWPPEHSRRHPLRHYDPACHVRPLGPICSGVAV